MGVTLVGAKGHIHHHQRTVHSTHHRCGVVDHLVERNRQRAFKARHHVRRRITHQDHIDTSLIQDASHRVIVRSEHGDVLPPILHGLQHVGRHDTITPLH